MKLNNNALQELYDTIVNGTITISPHKESPIDKAFRECDEKLQKDIDFWKCGNENEFRKLKEYVLENHKIIAAIGYERDILTKERDDLLSRIHCAEDEVEKLKKAHDELFEAGSRKISELKATLEKANDDRTEPQNDCEFYHGLYTELKKDYDRLFEENKQIKKELHTAEEARNNLRAELEAKVERMDEITKDRDFFFKMYHALKNDYKKLEAKYRDMKSYSNCYAEGYSDGKEEGEENLWDMLQNVRDVKPEEFDPECETLGDILDMDLEDFLDAYKEWQEERKKVAEEAKKKHIEYMRGYLKRYCIGRLCTNCPLHDAYKPVTSCMFSRLTDEEVEKRYRTVISARLPQSWECTIEATVEINKDLLEKVCGVKTEEEEHKLEYGDAVRVPWRDYDYMYIGPDKRGDGKMIRLFDPKHHSVAYVSSNEHLDIRGYKIIIGNEEDLRKIWCNKE